MAENNIAGFKKLMRYAQNLAEYEQGIAEGIIDENVFIIVLEEKVAKFKGQTFDWSGGGDTEELEEVSAGALCELNTRVKAQYEATQQCVKKNDFESYVEKNSEQTQNSEVIVVSALIDLNKRINELFDRLNRIESR